MCITSGEAEAAVPVGVAVVQIETNESLLEHLGLHEETVLDESFSAQILFLGVSREFRRAGLGSTLLRKTISTIEKKFRDCLAVYCVPDMHRYPAFARFLRKNKFLKLGRKAQEFKGIMSADTHYYLLTHSVNKLEFSNKEGWKMFMKLFCKNPFTRCRKNQNRKRQLGLSEREKRYGTERSLERTPREDLEGRAARHQ